MKKQNPKNETGKNKLAPAFYPSILIIGSAAILGICNNQLLVRIFKNIFNKSLDRLGWIYQLMMLATFIIVTVITFSSKGRIRIGGKDAVPKYSFGSWFAMSLTGGIATGIIVYGVSEPMIYFQNIFGELERTGIKPGTVEAGIFSLSRCFYNWSFIPYTTFALVGVLIALLYFNYHQRLSVSSTLFPLFGKKVTGKFWERIIDTIAIIAIALGLAGTLGSGMLLIQSGLEIQYSVTPSALVLLGICVLFAIIYLTASVKGINNGIKRLAEWNTKIFYFLMLVVFLTGAKIFVCNLLTASLGSWGQNFLSWGLDPGLTGGEALVKWWTLQNWCFYFCYAPMTGIFLAQISYGHTVREFMVVNWILPSVFTIIWFTIWGGNGIAMEMSHTADISQAIASSGATAGLWEFLSHIPLGGLFIPIVLVTLVISFSTAADGLVTSISSLCVKGLAIGQEAPIWLKVLWGASIAAIAFIMILYGNGEQGLEGIKYIGSVAGVVIFLLYILQILSALKLFFGKKPPQEDK